MYHQLIVFFTGHTHKISQEIAIILKKTQKRVKCKTTLFALFLHKKFATREKKKVELFIRFITTEFVPKGYSVERVLPLPIQARNNCPCKVG